MKSVLACKTLHSHVPQLSAPVHTSQSVVAMVALRSILIPRMTKCSGNRAARRVSLQPMMAVKLSTQSLDSLASSEEGVAVPVPTYDRKAVIAGIVHIGVGGFHRAHQAMYLDRLMNKGGALEWGICGMGVMPSDVKMRDALKSQDNMYTLVLKNDDGTWDPRVIGSIKEFIFAPDDPEAAIEKLADPAIKIVSLTVTEGGYSVHSVTGEFAPSDAVRADANPSATPTTFFGLITEALVRREKHGIKPFTIMSCDNIPGNGDLAKKVFTAFAALRDAELGEWVANNVAFPNSMVDRITPGTTDDVIAELAERFGIEDAWPVVAEPFTQWVEEDSFTNGRPRFEDVGVQMVYDVEPYELMKLRLLNASHQSLAYLGHLAGYTYVHEMMKEELYTSFLLAYMGDEAAPTLPLVPGQDIAEYKTTLINRFSNGYVSDTLLRLCAETSDRIPKFLLPVVQHNLENGGRVELSALVIASWARYAEGADEDGKPHEVVDALADELTTRASKQGEDGTMFIEYREVFGNLVDDKRFVEAYTDALRSLHKIGAQRTVEAFMKARS